MQPVGISDTRKVKKRHCDKNWRTSVQTPQLLEKPPEELRRRYPAGFPLAKPPVAIASHPVISRITNRPRDHDQSIEERPPPA